MAEQKSSLLIKKEKYCELTGQQIKRVLQGTFCKEDNSRTRHMNAKKVQDNE